MIYGTLFLFVIVLAMAMSMSMGMISRAWTAVREFA